MVHESLQYFWMKLFLKIFFMHSLFFKKEALNILFIPELFSWSLLVVSSILYSKIVSVWKNFHT